MLYKTLLLLLLHLLFPLDPLSTFGVHFVFVQFKTFCALKKNNHSFVWTETFFCHDNHLLDL